MEAAILLTEPPQTLLSHRWPPDPAEPITTGHPAVVTSCSPDGKPDSEANKELLQNCLIWVGIENP